MIKVLRIRGCVFVLGYKIGFIGAGNMTSAILNGALRRSVVRPENVYLSNPHVEKTESFRLRGVRVTASNVEVCRGSDIVILAVKPQKFDEVLPELAPYAEGKCVVSIAAGISSAYIKERLPGAYVVRAMPNTPLLVGKGMTALAEAPEVPSVYFESVTELFSAAGEIVLIPEERINAVIAVSGSSPAYFFRIASAMTAEGVKLGLEPDIALKLAASAMDGAAAMLLKSGKTAEELTRQVCSPGGTTLAALTAFDDGGLDAVLTEAMERCVKRAEELGK